MAETGNAVLLLAHKLRAGVRNRVGGNEGSIDAAEAIKAGGGDSEDPAAVIETMGDVVVI